VISLDLKEPKMDLFFLFSFFLFLLIFRQANSEPETGLRVGRE
jgi:hypothetical protein